MIFECCNTKIQLETRGGVFAPTDAAKLVINAIGNNESEKDKKASMRILLH